MEDCKYLSLTYTECASRVKEIVQQSLSSPASKYWIVFDVDQTLLTDEKHRHLYKSRNDIFRYQHRPDHDAIQPMVDLYNWCLGQGMSMCILTGRANNLRETTCTNLRNVGITKYHKFYTKTGREDTMSFKSRCRKEIIEAGGIILVNIGDQESDLLIPASPNPVYGYARHAIKLPSTY